MVNSISELRGINELLTADPFAALIIPNRCEIAIP
jgi:hypothetical protein